MLSFVLQLCLGTTECRQNRYNLVRELNTKASCSSGILTIQKKNYSCLQVLTDHFGTQIVSLKTNSITDVAISLHQNIPLMYIDTLVAFIIYSAHRSRLLKNKFVVITTIATKVI